MKGKAKMVFPGGNTCLGFYSFYDNIIGPDANRIFVIKGGPGVGKSTFMGRIGEELREMGYDVELHCCSSDNASLDAVVVPALRVALIDGTAPHVVDPKNPGAVDEIVNLGEFWDDAKLIRHREEIVSLNRRVAKHFAAAYSSLRMAKVARDEEMNLRSEAFCYGRFNGLLGDLLRMVFGEKLCWVESEPEVRHLFASALTPEGIVNHLGTVLDGVESLYVVKGEPGSGAELLLAEFLVYAFRSVFKMEVYHCAFDPAQVDLIVLPELRTAVLKQFPELDFDPAFLPCLKSCEKIDADVCIDAERLAEFREGFSLLRRIYAECLERALQHIKMAKQLHDEMERYYVEAMDFGAIEEKRVEVLRRILDYAR